MRCIPQNQRLRSTAEGPCWCCGDINQKYATTYPAPAKIFAGSHNASSPFSRPAAITPCGRFPPTCPHAKRLNLYNPQYQQERNGHKGEVIEPSSIFNVSFGIVLTLSSQIKLIFIKEIRCPYFKLTFVTKRLVKGAGYSPRGQQRKRLE